MTSKCKTCGHEKKEHKWKRCRVKLKESFTGENGVYYPPKWCKCEKFQPEDEICSKGKCGYGESCDYCKKKLKGWIKDWKKQKKGSSEEKVWKDYLNHVKKKQKGCGKMAWLYSCREGDLCQSCSNQSPKIPVMVSRDKPEDQLNMLGRKYASGTSTLSDKIVQDGRHPEYDRDVLTCTDVREFIRRLKDEYCYCVEKIKPCRSCEFIDKLAGSKLLEGGSKNDR